MNDRSERISRLLAKQKSRTAYIKAKLAVLVPAQIRALRLKSKRPPMPRQKDLAREAGMHQSRISMFETPGANVTLETLAQIAAALRCGLIVKFVPFSGMLKWENDFSQETFDVIPRLDSDTEFLNPDAVVQGLPLTVGAYQPVTNVSASMVTMTDIAGDIRKPVASAQAVSAANEAGGAYN